MNTIQDTSQRLKTLKIQTENTVVKLRITSLSLHLYIITKSPRSKRWPACRMRPTMRCFVQRLFILILNVFLIKQII